MKNKTESLSLLRKYRLKPTLQRIFLAEILFGEKDEHFCAEDLKRIIAKKGFKMSLATIYNNLQNFAEVGLLKQRRISKNKSYFDNNISDHYHFYDDENSTLTDIPKSSFKISKFPKLPHNKKIKSIDLVINLEKK
tara:strand:- start:237 stop:644 length:408 start_codon:yes stop_codon:yes gene_type:complete